MNFLLGNPWGLLGLLSTAAVLAIHFLQKRGRRVRITTLFLLPERDHMSERGTHFTRLRTHAAFWCQILASLLLTWLLVQPRWLRSDDVLPVAVVLDSSLSMQAFKADVCEALSRHARTMGGTLKVDWHLMETDPLAGSRYRGLDTDELLAAVDSWTPRLMAHDPNQSLIAARSAVGREGLVVFVTDHDVPADAIPAGAQLLSVGRPIENVGLLGATAEKDASGHRWRTLVRNYGGTERTAEWTATAAGQRVGGGTLKIPAGRTLALSGTFPEGTDRLRIELGADAFAADNVLPVAKSLVRDLRLGIGGDLLRDVPPLRAELESLAASLPGCTTGGGAPDLVFLQADKDGGATQASVLFAAPGACHDAPPKPIVAENNPLTDGLSLNGLLVNKVSDFVPKPDDAIVLWRGNHPLIFMRAQPGRPLQLVCNFALGESNALRLPGFFLMLSRFVERVRENRLQPWRDNYELREWVRLPEAPAGQAWALDFEPARGGAAVRKPITGQVFRAPDEPGFVKVSTEGARPMVVLEAGVHHADPRESDFSDAKASDSLPSTWKTTRTMRSQEDMLAPLWLLGVLFALVGAWAWYGRADSRSQQPDPTRP